MNDTIRKLDNRVFQMLTTLAKVAAVVVAVGGVGFMSGCEVDSFLFDPSKTGRFEHTPTLIPVLDRIDVIEPEREYFARSTPVTPEDLVPSVLAYTIYPGDVATVNIYELYQPGAWFGTTRRIDPAGYFRVPELGDIPAAGLTAQQFQDALIKRLKEQVFTEEPQVDVVLEQTGGLRYTVTGYIGNQAMYTLQNPDLRLRDALAIAGGVPVSTKFVYIIRHVKLSSEVEPGFLRRGEQPPATPKDGDPSRSIEDLIDELDRENGSSVSPGMLSQETTPPIDIDSMESVPSGGVGGGQDKPPIDIEQVRPSIPSGDDAGDTFIYIESRGEWVRVKREDLERVAQPGWPSSEPPMILERIIKIDYQRLARGDSSLNIVVRPNDTIYVDGPLLGNVYIGGEVARPGTYNLPVNDNLTLSRLVTSAGGLNAIAVATRVDLTRVVGENLEATVRLDLAAIRQRTEPDVVMKPNDHVLIGTSFLATPMAVIRNGFRATYGFGFLLDRNFGNDVFGAPPANRFGQ